MLSAVLDILGYAQSMSQLNVGYLVLHHAFYFFTMLIAIQYLYTLYTKNKSTILEMKSVQDLGNLPANDFTGIMIILAATIAIGGSFLMPFATTGGFLLPENFTVPYLVGYYVVFTIFTVIVTVVPSRLAKAMTKNLQTNLEVKRTFVRHVGHEIRTPLNTGNFVCSPTKAHFSLVFMGLELLRGQLEEEIPDSEALETLAVLRESCVVAVDILNELLQYEKLEAGMMTLEKEDLYPLPFIVQSCSPFMVQAQQKGVTYSILANDFEDLSDENYLRHWNLSIDKAKMSQVMRNLCSNAIKFTKPGGSVAITAQIIIEKEDQTYLRMEIKDTGYGIALENQHRVFNEVVQFHASKQQGGGGSGFGLVITKKIVELHGGKVGLWSEGEGKGCTFFVELPVHECEVDTEEYEQYRFTCSRQSVRSSLHSTASKNKIEGKFCFSNKEPKRKLNVLVVDDSSLNRKMIRKMLERLGHFVEEADDGDIAVERFQNSLKAEKYFDLILMDSQMPRMSGPEAASIIRQLGFTGFIAALTGNALKGDIEEYKRMGADTVLLKPIDSKVLDSLIEEVFLTHQKPLLEVNY